MAENGESPNGIPSSADTSALPRKHVEFCKAVARLAREHGLEAMEGKFRPPVSDTFNTEVVFFWSSGKQGEEAERIIVRFQQLTIERISLPSNESVVRTVGVEAGAQQAANG